MAEYISGSAENSSYQEASYNDLQEQLSSAINRLQEERSHFYESFRRSVELRQSIQLPPLDPFLKDLAVYGWYVDFSMNVMDIFKAKKFINESNITAMDEMMGDLVSQRIESLVQNICKKFPAREKPLNEAFEAHSKEMYFVAIPVFLAQIDGICDEVTTKKFFINHHKEGQFIPQISEWAKSLGDARKLLAGVLLTKGAFQLHHSQHNEITFTRHSILHGDSSDYGTRINSLRVISLLAYLFDIFTPRRSV
jgi:hypothetical protein